MAVENKTWKDWQQGRLGGVGPAGPAGSAATVSVGTTTTVVYPTPASVTNSGSSSAAVLNFSIPSGPPGPSPSGTANQVLATPDGASGTAALRSLVEADLPASARIDQLKVVIGAIGGTITTGLNGLLTIPYNCTITSWTLLGDVSGSASIDLWFIAGSAPPTAPAIPTVTNLISASAPISMTTAQSAAGDATAISTWTKTLTQWGTLGFNVSSVTTVHELVVQLQVQRT